MRACCRFRRKYPLKNPGIELLCKHRDCAVSVASSRSSRNCGSARTISCSRLQWLRCQRDVCCGDTGAEFHRCGPALLVPVPVPDPLIVSMVSASSPSFSRILRICTSTVRSITTTSLPRCCSGAFHARTLFRVGGKKCENFEFFAGKKISFLHADGITPAVNIQSANTDRRRLRGILRLLLGPAEHRLDAGHEFARTNWLLNVVIRASSNPTTSSTSLAAR